ncbi:MAG: right-handed parallel beta-helix repeat-containing protein [Candidatus Thorarchaeota archaeon]
MNRDLLLFILLITAFCSINDYLSIETIAAIGKGDYPPPANDNWIITQPTTVENETILLNGSLIIMVGGNLTLRDAILQMNCAYDGQYNITIENGGYLIVENSTVTAFDSSHAWFLSAEANSTIRFNRSKFYYAGYYEWAAYDRVGLWANGSNVQIANCMIYDNFYGLSLYHVENARISNNSFDDCGFYGIKLESSHSNALTNNAITNTFEYGIALQSSNYNTLTGNSLDNSRWDGILIQSSSHNAIFNNRVTDGGDGISVEDSLYTSIYNNQIDNHSYSGIILRNAFHNLIKNNTVTQSLGVWSAIHVTKSINSTIVQNTIDNCSKGISVFKSETSTLVANTVWNTSSGLRIVDSPSSLITNNSVIDRETSVQGAGIVLYNSSNSQLTANLVKNHVYGIKLENSASNCALWGNILQENAINAVDNNGVNLWDNGTHGNWWDDYTGIDSNKDGIGDIPYSIYGGTGVQDRYPLMEPLGSDNYPPKIGPLAKINFDKEGTGFTITWNVYDRHPANYTIYRNGTEVKSGNWNGEDISYHKDGLQIGHYNYTLVVRDFYGNRAEDTVFIEITVEKATKSSGFTFFGLFFLPLALFISTGMTKRITPRKSKSDSIAHN